MLRMHPDRLELVGAVAHQVGGLDDVGVDNGGAGDAHQVTAVIGDVVGQHAFQYAQQRQLVGALPVVGLAANDKLLRIVAGKDRGQIRDAPGLRTHIAGRDFAARADLLHLDRVGRVVIDRLGRIVAEVLPAGHVDGTSAQAELRGDRRVGKQDPGLVNLQRLDVLLERVLRIDGRNDRIRDTGIGVCHFCLPSGLG
ncbi:hypothetical protein [Mesorhizobium sp. M0814]